MRHSPLESGAPPSALAALPHPHSASQHVTHPGPLFPRAWALSLPPPRECQRQALGVQWDAPSAEGSWPFAGVACATLRWTDATGALAAQQALAEQDREHRWQRGAHPGWRPGRKLALLSGAPLVGCLGIGQGHPGLPSCLGRGGCEIHLQGMDGLQVPGR